MSDTSRKAKKLHVTKEQDANTEDRKNPESKQTETSKKKPLTAYRKEGNLKKKEAGAGGGSTNLT